MNTNKSFLMMSRHTLIVSIILVCLTGVLLAQTFQYSCGWTNGKKRSPVVPLMYNWKKFPEVRPFCEMFKRRYAGLRQQPEADLSREDSRPNWKYNDELNLLARNF